MNKLIFIFIILTSSLAQAGLYQCSSADAEPKYVGSSSDKKITFEKSKPEFQEHALHPQLHTGKQSPFLVYYAIDSAEPFMQYSVKYEIARLKTSCENDQKVNFVAILNSLYVEKNEVIVCKKGKYKHIDLSSFPDVDESLKNKREYLRNGDHSGGEPGMMRYLVRYKSVVNEAFYNYPLAHPDFLFDLITLVTNNETFFPNNEFMPFLNLKSHGNKQNVLSGLHNCQIQAKINSQTDFLKNKLTIEERNLLEEVDFSSHLPEIEKVLHKIALGSAIGVGGEDKLGKDFLGKDFLGKEFLGKDFLGKEFLGSTVAGLGNSEGLGADYSFGTYHIALSSVLKHLFHDKNENDIRFLGFVMLESCDTNRNISFHHESLELVVGVYSAKHSLWYRNLNWWTFLEEANGSTKRMVELLQLHSGNIENIIVH